MTCHTGHVTHDMRHVTCDICYFCPFFPFCQFLPVLVLVLLCMKIGSGKMVFLALITNGIGCFHSVIIGILIQVLYNFVNFEYPKRSSFFHYKKAILV